MPAHAPGSPHTDFDYVVVGGGLQGALVVLALRAQQPSARIALVERAARLGGNHTWCFHASDVSDAARQWLDPLVVAEWSAYAVRFPDGDRVLGGAYAAILSDRLHTVITSALASGQHEILTGTRASGIEPDLVRLDSGRTLSARLVIDARGPTPATSDDPAGFQKFFGQELELEASHGLEHPLLMDARVDQTDGFRFFYVLPFSSRRVLVEETRFSSTPGLDEGHARSEIVGYCRARRWRVTAIGREERGVLPMPWSGATLAPEPGVLVAGYRGGWFHPGTGYSLPVAARLAEAIARHTPEEVRAGALHGLYREHGRQREFCHLLNRMLFRWYPPEMRWHVFSRFYRLPHPVIERFYALRMGTADQARLVVGRPPRGLSVRHRLRSGEPS